MPRHIQCGSRWAPVSLSLRRNLSTPLGLASWRYTAPSQIAPTQRALPSPMALFMTQSGGTKNLSTQSKQLISLPGCLGSSNVIIIPTKALVSVRLISTTATDMIIKVPGFLCSKSYADEAHKVCFGGETKHGIFFFSSTSLLPASFLTEIRERLPECPACSCQQTQTYGGCDCGYRMLTGGQKPRDEAGVMARGGCWLLPRDLARWHLPWRIPQPLAPSLGGLKT